MLSLISRRDVWYMILYYKDLTLDIDIHSQVPYLEEPFIFTHSFTHQLFSHDNGKDNNIEKGRFLDFRVGNIQRMLGILRKSKTSGFRMWWEVRFMEKVTFELDNEGFTSWGLVGKDISDRAKAYKQFWRISKNQSCQMYLMRIIVLYIVYCI